MSDNFEFDDNDDVLLKAFCTPPSDIPPEQSLQEGNDENVPIKRLKLNESESPILQFSHTLSKAAKKSAPLGNKSIPSPAKRLFPGPAGILLGENQTDFCSQDTSFFQDDTWKEMSKDFRISNSYLYDKFNIDWIKKEATSNKFANQKAPFLAGILLSLEVSEGHTQKSVNITLKDMTGTIKGTILQTLYEEYASQLTLGSVLVLFQFGVLSCTCDKCDNHHLTVTPKNLSAIYTGRRKIVIKQIDPGEVLKEYCQRKKELEFAEEHRNLKRRSNLSNPIVSSTNVNTCAYSADRNNSSKNYLSSNVNRAITNSQNASRKSGGASNNFTLPKGKSINKTCVDTSVVKEVQKLNGPISISTTTPPNRLFTFKKVDTLAKSSVSNDNLTYRPLSDSAAVTKCNSISSNLNSTSNCQLLDYSNLKKGIYNSNTDNVIIGKGQLSVKVDKAEHEKIWKDLLEDVDMSCLFEDDF